MKKFKMSKLLNPLTAYSPAKSIAPMNCIPTISFNPHILVVKNPATDVYHLKE